MFESNVMKTLIRILKVIALCLMNIPTRPIDTTTAAQPIDTSSAQLIDDVAVYIFKWTIDNNADALTINATSE